MTDRPAQRPEGALIERAQKRSKFSQRAAARMAGISENHWRNIVKGYSTVTAGVTAPIRGSAEHVARMAQIVGVTPEQLEGEGERADAAAVLRELTEPPEPRGSAGTSAIEDMTTAELIAKAQELMAQADEYLRRARGETA